MATLTMPRSTPALRAVPPIPGGLPWLGNWLQFRTDRIGVQDAAARTGPIARMQMGPIPIYVITDAELAREVLVEPPGAFLRSPALEIMKPLLGEGLLTADGEPHRKHRKLLAPAFAPKRLAAYAEVMIDETLRQLGGWLPGQHIDLSREMMEMTLAIAGKTMFGADVRSDARDVEHALDLGMRAHSRSIASPLRLPLEWPLPRHLQMRRAASTLDSIVFRMIAEGRARGTDRGDVLSILLLARDDEDGTGLSDRQIRDEVMTLLLAGHETTANALTWTWYELARNPRTYEVLRAEIATLGGRRVTLDDLPHLPYNLAVIEETLRLHPPAYMLGRLCARDFALAGHTFPKGSILTVNIRGIHRRADYYPDPDAFSPERWLGDARKQRPRERYLPFGSGPRVCIGQHFALLEAQLALATMIQKVKLRRPSTAPVAYDPQITLRPKGGMPMITGMLPTA